ncbi:acyltransferase 3 [Paraphoma chrysanthemicola]|uniref:Acyltransferase 3 n=1 Tax=Paraphoma chrysanthemicola TaxID=798071 RepID=A0A8K0R1R0_9PLEO|nr:acyltransferase 3 [Paraphoma chrysanthemicola]
MTGMQRKRTYALDNLRTFLTVLVIFHHAALAYGGTGSFSYRSPYHPPGSSVVLTAFNVVNQTFFMGMFFLLSGYFSSIAATKRNRAVFLKEKIKRLGAPTLLYSLLGKGLIRAIICRQREGADWADAAREFVNGVQSTKGVGGPMWYTSLLLIFDTIYAASYPHHFHTTPANPPPAQSPPTPPNGPTSEKPNQSLTPTSHQLKTRHILIALTLTSLSSFTIRTHYPFTHIFHPLNLNPGYLPQYILSYAGGIYIQLSEIALRRLCTSRAIATTTTLAAAFLAFGVVHARAFVADGGTLAEVMLLAGGGPNMFALVYALLNEFIGFTLSAILLRAFHTRFLSARGTVFGHDIARCSYAAFLVHIPVLVGIMTLVDEEKWKCWSPIYKTVGVGVVGVVGSWVVGMLVRMGVERGGGRGYL